MTLRVTHGMLQRNILADLNASTARIARTQSQMASGLQRAKPSDDPVGAARSLRLTSALEGVKQLQANVADGQSWTDAAETSMSALTDVVARARNLLIQGAGDNTDQAARNAIALEMDQLAEAAKDQANTSLAGRYVFGGTRTDAAPYTAGTGDAYQGDTGTVAREIGQGVSVTVNVNAVDLMGSGGTDGKLLSVLRDIATHLRSGDGASLRSTDLVKLDQSRDTVLEARASNGALARRLEASGDQLIAFQEQTTKALGLVDSADYATVSIEFATGSAAYQAALKAGASIVQASLMDFLS